MIAYVNAKVKHIEHKTSAGGAEYTRLEVVESTAGKDKNGNSASVWMDLLVFGRRSEWAETYLHDGSVIWAVGHIGCRAYLGRDGEAKARLSMTPIEIGFGPISDAQPQRQAVSYTIEPTHYLDEPETADIPF